MKVATFAILTFSNHNLEESFSFKFFRQKLMDDFLLIFCIF